jgi:hypothetical protein
MLVRLLYASRIAEGQGPEVVDSILQKSRSRNPQLGITGVLCYDGSVFIQALEGGRNVVSNLYNRIAADPRHKDVVILNFEEITERCFAGWTMGLVSLKSVTPCLLLRYSERAELDPYSISGSVSLALLKELIATAQVIGRSS